MNSETTSYNDRIVREFRAHAGQVGGEWAGTPLILVHHVGARSGTERVTPLGCFPLDDGRYAVAASSGGSPQHPAWYHNLKAHPSITVEVGAETFTAAAQDAAGTAGLGRAPGALACEISLAIDDLDFSRSAGRTR